MKIKYWKGKKSQHNHKKGHFLSFNDLKVPFFYLVCCKHVANVLQIAMNSHLYTTFHNFRNS